MPAAAGLGGEVNIAVIVLAREEGSGDALSPGDFAISAVELGLEAASFTQVHGIKVAFVVEVDPFVLVVGPVVVISLKALPKQVDIVLGHLVELVDVILNLDLLLDVVFVVAAMGNVEGGW
jgi:hypothetical protein